MLDRLTIERMLSWTGDRPVLVALSGGGDSVALLHLMVAELGAARVRAAIVDHALREGSAADAARALSFAEAAGVEAEILTLTWEVDANRAQQAARERRYQALSKFARARDINVIATAHTADDQAETVLMRAASGSTWRGLAGMAPFTFAPVWPEGAGIALGRPLLGVRREALRGFLNAQRASWIEDPANANPKFERVRVRHRLAELDTHGFESTRLVCLAARLRGRCDGLDAAAHALIARSVADGLGISIERARWDAPHAVRRRALCVLMAAVAGAAREPPWTEMVDLERRALAHNHSGFTHSGVEFIATEVAVKLTRDPGAVLGRADGTPPLPPLSTEANVEAIWDGRLGVTAPEAGWRVVPARNAELVVFENGLVCCSYREARERLQLRPLAAERIAHAFAPDINRAKP